MVITYELKNSTNLFIVDIFKVNSFLSSENIDFPKCIFQLMDKSLSESEFSEIIKLLINRNCKLISFCGSEAEHYHDMADYCIESCGNGAGVMTTYHDDETSDEIANFVVNGISTVNSERLLLITEDCDRDAIKEELIKL
jgi:hypothetical protein